MADLGDLSDKARQYCDEGGKAIAVQVDVSNNDQTQAMAKAALDAFGSIDGIINNAGFSAAVPLAP